MELTLIYVICCDLFQDGKALLRACENDKMNVVKELIKAGADLEWKNNNDETPLYKALFKGNLDIATLLIKHGAYLECKDRDGDTPLHVAAWGGNLNSTELLIKHGASPLSTNNQGAIPLYIAQSLDVIDCLLPTMDTDINIVDSEGNTLLHKAAQYDNRILIDALFMKGLNNTAVNKKGETAEDVARNNNNHGTAYVIKHAIIVKKVG